MTITLQVLVCLIWFAYLVNTEFFLPSNDAILMGTTSSIQAGNELMCSRYCKRIDGCKFFSFNKTSGYCTLTGNSVTGVGSSALIYTRRRCEHGERYGDSCYALVDIAAYWPSAQAFCLKHGYHLATITNEDEKAFVANLVRLENPSGVDIWLGGVSTAEWISGNELSYSNWESGFPKMENITQCLKMWVGFTQSFLYFSECGMNNQYICEKEVA